MKTIRIVFILSVLHVLSEEVYSQPGYKACYGFDCKEKKWSVSLFGGLSVFGPGQKIKEQMSISGLGDPDEVFDGSTFKIKDYPFVDPPTSWSISVKYAISKKNGLQLTTGNSYHATVVGHDDIGLGNDMGIESNIWTTCFNYVRSFRNGKDGITIGPVIATYTATGDNRLVIENKATSSSVLKFGFNVGYTFSLIQTKSWFLSANLNSTWLPSAEIGPYSVGHVSNYPPEYKISTFPKTTVPLSHFSFGLSSGVKF